MLHAIVPFSFIKATIRPEKLSVAIFLIFDVLPYISTPVRKLKLALSVHAIKLPVALVPSLIGPLVNTRAMDIIVLEFTSVLRTVRPLESSHPVLLPLLVLSNIV